MRVVTLLLILILQISNIRTDNFAWKLILYKLLNMWSFEPDTRVYLGRFRVEDLFCVEERLQIRHQEEYSRVVQCRKLVVEFRV